MTTIIHATAVIDNGARIGKGSKVWHHSHIRAGADIGENCVISKNVYVDNGAVIGNNVKVQNNVSVYSGVTIEDGAFIGPHVSFMNDKVPRAINLDGSLKEAEDWKPLKTLVKKGASIGTGVLIMPSITIGEFAMIGAGSLVTKDVPDFGLVIGSPARLVGYVCKCGERLIDKCDKCGMEPIK